MSSRELREKFLSFFSKRGHKIVPSSSLIPQDPTVLFTTAGMQQFSKYLSGEEKPPYKRACSVQKCFRTDDIEEVGDLTHHTFFEMLGNWSFAYGSNSKLKTQNLKLSDRPYWKKEAIEYALEFLLKECGLDKSKISITVFKGDEETIKIWEKHGFKREEIKECGKKDNWWGPVGEEGPCGSCSEIYYQGVEIWNLVFMQYYQERGGKLKELPNKNIDTGIGLERLAAILQNKKSSYETDLFWPGIRTKEQRIVADHIRAICFLIADGVTPSNVKQGYILRRLIRRVIRLEKNILPLIQKVISLYQDIYPELRKADIISIVQNEEEKFRKALTRGKKAFEKIIDKEISGEQAFRLYETYGLPLDLIKELAQEKGTSIDEKGFKRAFKKHQEISRRSIGQFKAGLADHKPETIKLHTATHLLLAALQKVLDKNIKQMGSNITSERLRFDFNFPRKLTAGEIKKIEELVNQKIQENLEVKKTQKGEVSYYSIGKFKIIKEESSSAGVRRIKAILESQKFDK
jgi:alanyl-tRNA synthetase